MSSTISHKNSGKRTKPDVRNEIEIIESSTLDPAEKYYVTTILDNYYKRGLLWHNDSQITKTIAVTELIVLANCLKKYQAARIQKLKSIALSNMTDHEKLSELKRLLSLEDKFTNLLESKQSKDTEP